MRKKVALKHRQYIILKQSFLLICARSEWQCQGPSAHLKQCHEISADGGVGMGRQPVVSFIGRKLLTEGSKVRTTVRLCGAHHVH